MKKICFAICVHENTEAIKDLLDNIRYFCPNSSIVLYHSGWDPHLCDGLGYLVCPTSKSLEWSRTFVLYHLETMKWLNEIQYSYDYLIFIDSDVLFFKKGYEEFVNSEMDGFDLMAVSLRSPEWHWSPGQTMHYIWWKWQPLLNRQYFLACFNNGQVFSRTFVQKILAYDKLPQIEEYIWHKDTAALEEILFVTLADSMGLKLKPYPEDAMWTIRWRPHVTVEDVQTSLERSDRCYLLHPVYRDMNDPARVFVRSLIQ